MDWARILAFVTGMVDQELLARIEYLGAVASVSSDANDPDCPSASLTLTASRIACGTAPQTGANLAW
jgi:hypothetical protein